MVEIFTEGTWFRSLVSARAFKLSNLTKPRKGVKLFALKRIDAATIRLFACRF